MGAAGGENTAAGPVPYFNMNWLWLDQHTVSPIKIQYGEWRVGAPQKFGIFLRRWIQINMRSGSRAETRTLGRFTTLEIFRSAATEQMM